MGDRHSNDEGVIKSYSEAAEWFRKAAEERNAEAQYNMATLYENGYGVPKDYLQAVEWYIKAAEQGHPVAQKNVRLLLKDGQFGQQQQQQQEQQQQKSKTGVRKPVLSGNYFVLVAVYNRVATL